MFYQLVIFAFSCVAAYDKSFWKNYGTDRKASIIQSMKISEALQQSNQIILDTRSSQERNDYDISVMNIPEDSVYVVIDYNNFHDKTRFFGSFDKNSKHYDSSNDGTDVDIFSGVDVSQIANDDVQDISSKIILICGERRCGCRWSAMYRNGFRGQSWYIGNINQFIAYSPKKDQ